MGGDWWMWLRLFRLDAIEVWRFSSSSIQFFNGSANVLFMDSTWFVFFDICYPWFWWSGLFPLSAISLYPNWLQWWQGFGVFWSSSSSGLTSTRLFPLDLADFFFLFFVCWAGRGSATWACLRFLSVAVTVYSSITNSSSIYTSSTSSVCAAFSSVFVADAAPNNSSSYVSQVGFHSSLRFLLPQQCLRIYSWGTSSRILGRTLRLFQTATGWFHTVVASSVRIVIPLAKQTRKKTPNKHIFSAHVKRSFGG